MLVPPPRKGAGTRWPGQARRPFAVLLFAPPPRIVQATPTMRAYLLLAAALLAAHIAPSSAIFGWGSEGEEEGVLKPMVAYSEYCAGLEAGCKRRAPPRRRRRAR